MPDLPASVSAYVHTHLLATRTPAYLLVQKDGCLEAWGGDLARYGLVGLQQGIEVERQVHMLAGLLSREAVPLCLPCIETPSGRFVDLHLFPTAAGMGVLFLDATGEEVQRRVLQQKANEMVLLQEYYTAIFGRRQGQDAAHDPIRHLRGALLTASLFAQVFAALDTVVMERTAEGVFRLLSTVPEWFTRVYPEAASQRDGLQPGHIFPFLEPFLMDADQVWRAQGTGQLKSGPWSAIDPTGQDYALEASALCLGKHQILCLALSHIVFSLEAPKMQGALSTELLAVLDMVVMERMSVGSFRLSGPAPAWFRCFCPEVTPGQEGLHPGDTFPFLANFLVDAEQFWLTYSAGHLRSGLWNETDARGHEHHLEASALCLGERQFLLLALPNITYTEKQAIIQKARENSLAYARFHKEVQQKELLFHCIVHDFAGPLTAILFGLSLLEANPVSAAGKQAMETCLHQARRLQELVQQVLEVFAAEVRPLTAPVHEPISAPDIVGCAQRVVEVLQPSCLHKQVTLQLAPAIDTVTDCWVVGDPARLERVIFNLLENAIRHSPMRAAVRVGITAEAAGVLVTVDDEGPGVPPDLVDTMFEKFSQARANTGKVGLGLYFCRITIESWDGTIGYTPRATGGAQFWFRLPHAAPPQAINAAQ